jgi:hypothetical protein
MGEPLSSFSKLKKWSSARPLIIFSRLMSLNLIAFLFLPIAQAININSIYTAACRRDVGLIIQVDDHAIQFLSLDGEMKRIPKHEIIYLAYYPSDLLPMKEFRNPESTDFYRITTSTPNGKLTPLVNGWPIGFTEDKIAFLSVDGKESVVGRRSIFQISRERINSAQRFSYPRDFKIFQFVQPHQFRDCPSDRFGGGKTQVLPQQILSQPVMIKRELDHFQAEAVRLNRYYREQNFYSVPEIHGNLTSLGLWHTFGYRHGGSSKRVSNFTPVLTDSYSSDIFDYQHTFVAGSAPLMTSFQEEPQVHSLYAFKASYFHFSAMADPNLILVGRNYKWQLNDFESPDDKWNSVTQIETGFDFGNWSLMFFLADGYQIGVYNGVDISSEHYPINRVGIQYRTHRFGFELSGGNGSDIDDRGRGLVYKTQLSGLRVNLSAYKLLKMDWTLSFIRRGIDYQSEQFFYVADDQTLALYGSYPLSARYRVGGFVSVEGHNNKFTRDNNWYSDSNSYIKLGTQFSLNF